MAQSLSRPILAQPDDTAGPEQIALRDEILKRLEPQSATAQFYAGRAYTPFWLMAPSGETSQPPAMNLVATLSLAGQHALPAARYEGEALRARLSALPSDPAQAARLELDLTRVFLRYARDVHSGLLTPSKVSRDLYIQPERPNPADLLHAAASTLDMGQDMGLFLARLAPDSREYNRLLEEYAQFRAMDNADIWGPAVDGGPALRPEMRDGRVPQLRARLMAMGDFLARGAQSKPIADNVDSNADNGVRVATSEYVSDAYPGAQSTVKGLQSDTKYYGPELVAAVKRFQRRHGLNPDGVIGPATLAQLNISSSERAKQIAVNLERMRWMNRDLGPRYVWVNLASFMMALVEQGQPTFVSRVVIGKVGRNRTPEFNDMMTHMIVNPSWHVPNSIAKAEILPKLQKDPSYLTRNNMRLVGAGVPAEEIDWSRITPGTFPGRVTQGPGERNALGNVKFMFPNQFAIYLHDTPSKMFFRRDVRAYSHGCVRVEKPYDFAYRLLEGQVDNPEASFQSWLNRGKERRINLERPLPVYLTYRTAWVEADGQLSFRGDIYGRDSVVFDALTAAGVTIR